MPQKTAKNKGWSVPNGEPRGAQSNWSSHTVAPLATNQDPLQSRDPGLRGPIAWDEGPGQDPEAMVPAAGADYYRHRTAKEFHRSAVDLLWNVDAWLDWPNCRGYRSGRQVQGQWVLGKFSLSRLGDGLGRGGEECWEVVRVEDKSIKSSNWSQFDQLDDRQAPDP